MRYRFILSSSSSLSHYIYFREEKWWSFWEWWGFYLNVQKWEIEKSKTMYREMRVIIFTVNVELIALMSAWKLSGYISESFELLFWIWIEIKFREKLNISDAFDILSKKSKMGSIYSHLGTHLDTFIVVLQLALCHKNWIINFIHLKSVGFLNGTKNDSIGTN